MVMRRKDSEAAPPVDDQGNESPERAPSGESDQPEVVNRYTGTGVSTVLLGMFIVFVIGIIVLAQNTEAVPFSFLFWETNPPLFVLLLGTIAAAAASTLVVAEIWRRRRRRTRTEREELERLRREHGSAQRT